MNGHIAASVEQWLVKRKYVDRSRGRRKLFFFFLGFGIGDDAGAGGKISPKSRNRGVSSSCKILKIFPTFLSNLSHQAHPLARWLLLLLFFFFFFFSSRPVLEHVARVCLSAFRAGRARARSTAKPDLYRSDLPQSIDLWKGLFWCKVFLYRAYILDQSSLDEMKGI